jgi:hypothetical protein
LRMELYIAYGVVLSSKLWENEKSVQEMKNIPKVYILLATTRLLKVITQK